MSENMQWAPAAMSLCAGVFAANPNARMPAATAARMPVGVSSITAQADGATPSVRAANRNTSGAGFGFATSTTLNILPSKRARSPVVSRLNLIFS